MYSPYHADFTITRFLGEMFMNTIRNSINVNGSNPYFLSMLLILINLSFVTVSAEPYMVQSINLAQAQKVVEAAINECGLIDGKVTISVAVVDVAGQPVVQIRSDNSAPHNWELVFRKAYTARTFRRPSIEWRDRTDGTDRAGQRELSTVIPLGGGAPIKVGDEIIGAVGVSGSPDGQPGDSACALAAAASIAGELQ
jgi:uncharacterized protein GlcG (DUF336 family)